MTFFLENNDTSNLKSLFPVFIVLSTPLKIINFHFFSSSPTSQKYILQIKKVSVQSGNNFWRYRSRRFGNTVSRKTRLKFYVSAEWPGVTHAFAATQMPITSGILRISANPFKHVFLNDWTFEKWNKIKNRLLDRMVPLMGYRDYWNIKKSHFLLLVILKVPRFVHIYNNVSWGNSNIYGNYSAEHNWVHRRVTASQSGMYWRLGLNFQAVYLETTFSNTVYIVQLLNERIVSFKILTGAVEFHSLSCGNSASTLDVCKHVL